MRIFVTGSAGFIGFHTAQRLLEAGHEVCGYDGMTNYYDPKLKKARHDILARSERFTRTELMLEDKDGLDRAIESFQPNIIIHLAAQAGVRYSIDHPQTYIDSNLTGTFNVLEAARRLKPDHLLFASTSSVYGANPDMPFVESNRTDFPVSLYAATKKAGEAMAHSYSSLFGIPTTAFRFFTVYGPWGRPDMALFKFVKAIREDRPIEIYGQGNMRRDFTYIDDLVDGIVSLMSTRPETGVAAHPNDSISPVAPFRTVNIAGGEPVGLMEFVEAIELATGIHARKTFLPMQPGDVVSTFAAPDLLEALTGATPQTSVTEGVRRFVEWYDTFSHLRSRQA